jgi:hypothetical protein
LAYWSSLVLLADLLLSVIFDMAVDEFWSFPWTVFMDGKVLLDM